MLIIKTSKNENQLSKYKILFKPFINLKLFYATCANK